MSVWKGGLWRSQFGGGGDNAGGGSNQSAGYRRYLTFDGGDGHVEVSGAAASISGLGQFSVEAVVWASDSYDGDRPKGEVFSATAASGPISIQLRQNSNASGYGNLLFGYRPQGESFKTATGTSSSPKERWVHIAGTLDTAAGEVSLYYDGELDITESSGLTGLHNFDDASIGRRPPQYNDRFFKGHIARVSLWQRALSAAEIADLAAAPPDASDPDMLHYWELDTGTDNIPDLAGNAEGTVLGGAQWGPKIPGYA